MNDILKAVGIGVLVLVLLVGCAVASAALGWITLPIDLFSRGNVQEQFTTGYDLYESLQSTSQAVCTAEAAVEAESNPDARTQRQSQLIAYETNYARISADYDKWSRNIFEGGLVRPSDLPDRAPSLQNMRMEVCQ